MAKLTASKAIDMFDLYFFETVTFSGTKKIVLDSDETGYQQEYYGTFKYDKDDNLVYSSSKLTGFKLKGEDGTLQWEASLSVTGSKFEEYWNEDDAEGLVTWALRGDDTITGSKFADYLMGFNGNDTINSGAGDDHIYGGSGKDTINAGDGNDLIDQGEGKYQDKLTGGKGADTFYFMSTNESGVGSKLRDTITDFKGSTEKDRIDLFEIDAFTGKAGNQAFTFIGNKKFTGTQGEVRFSGGILQMNTGTDKIADMEIALTGVTSFSKDFLIL